MNLVPVESWIVNSKGVLVPYPFGTLDASRHYTGAGAKPDFAAIMAEDVAPKMAKLISYLKGRGWKLIVSDIFRSAAVQAEAARVKQGLAAPLDTSFHQAGRAFDLDIPAMSKLSGFTMDQFERLANAAGFFRPLRVKEPWHFDTNDAGRSSSVANTFASIKDAIGAVGNLSTQAITAVAEAYAAVPVPAKAAGLGGAMLLVVGLGYFLFKGRATA